MAGRWEFIKAYSVGILYSWEVGFVVHDLGAV